MDIAEKLLQVVQGRTIEHFLYQSQEKRIRAHIARINDENPPEGRIDPDSDEALEVGIGALLDFALDRCEEAYGLRGSVIDGSVTKVADDD